MEQIISERVIGAGRRLRLLERDVQVTPDQVITWEVVDRGGDSVAMVAVDDDGAVYLVDEYFGATDQRARCLPKGMIDAGEDAATAALRELAEEIGLTGTPHLLTVLSVSPGYLTQRTWIYLVTRLREAAGVGDEVHHLRRVRLPLDDALAGCRTGDPADARTVAGLCLAAMHLGRLRPAAG